MNRLRNLLFGLAALLMLGHSLVPHEHDPSSPRPDFILWEVFSIDLGGDHLQHFAPSEVAMAADGIQSEQHPRLVPLAHWPESVHSTLAEARPTARTGSIHASRGHLSSWSRRPPPSKLT